MTHILAMTRRSLLVALAAGLALAVFLSTAPTVTRPAAQRTLDYTPQTGAIFNRPVGPVEEQNAIFTHVNNTIDATPAGATIRFAVYSFSEKPTAAKLIEAHQRGVNVQLIFNDHTIYEAERRLQTALGANPKARSFAIFCDGTCRGGKGNMHQKVFLFSRAGGAENVVMVGSNNMTRNNAVNQWSDIYTVTDDPALYFTYAGVFEQMKEDREVAQTYIHARVNDYQPEFYPRVGTTPADDPLLQALSSITCVGAAPGYGVARTVGSVPTRVTRVQIAQHAWNGDRGRYLAQKVVELHEAGCLVRVVKGVGFGKVVKSVLERGGVPATEGTVKGVHTHQKVFTVNGVFEGDPASTIVWNGSHNWSDGALRRDDVVLRVDSAEAWSQYAANFQDMWRNG